MNLSYDEKASIIFLLVIVWSLVWKGLALWKSAKRDNKVMFVLLLVINSLGILPISYLVYVKMKSKQTQVQA